VVDVLSQIDRIIQQWKLPWARSGQLVDVELWKDGRRQQVFVEARAHSIHFRSVAAPSRHVKQSSRYWRELALRAWRKNTSKEIVGFAFDRKDRLIGCAEHPGTRLTNRDLQTYVEVVARECDHMEFLLTGEDRA
jgi:hypothetical protein